MGPIKWFLFVYVLGGLTFIPLLIVLFLVHAYYTLPPAKDENAVPNDDPAQLLRPDDDKVAFKTATDDLAEQFHRKHDSDVAAGYFAVCREYVPGGVNGKPPEKLTPTGDVVVQESPSVYQSMYRSIFNPAQKPTIEPNKDGNGKNIKKQNNVFYVVLRFVLEDCALEAVKSLIVVDMDTLCFTTTYSRWKFAMSSLLNIMMWTFMPAAKKSPRENCGSNDIRSD